MGNCNASEEAQESKKIDRMLKDTEVELAKSIRIILLGAGESGKSTIFKQMKLISFGEFKDSEREFFGEIIQRSLFNQVKLYLSKSGMSSGNDTFDSLQVWSIEYLEVLQEVIEKLDLLNVITQEVLSKYQMEESFLYFLGKASEVLDDSYLPTDMDILRARIRTTGIDEAEFIVQNLSFTLIDVGGQRNERRKWIHSFQDIHTVLYVAALSEFNQILREDGKTNRLQESFKLFKELLYSPWFKESNIILFLNKWDVFQEKIKQGIKLSAYLDGAPDSDDPEELYLYIRKEFEAIVEKYIGDRDFHVYKTTAVDTKNVEKVINAVVDSLLKERMNGSVL